MTAEEENYQALKSALAGTGITVAAGKAGLEEAASIDAGWVMAAIAGTPASPDAHGGTARSGHCACEQGMSGISRRYFPSNRQAGWWPADPGRQRA